MLPDFRDSTRHRNCATEDENVAHKRFRIRLCAFSVLSFVAIVLLASSMIVQIANHSLFNSQTFEAGRGDQRLALVSTFFCQAIFLSRDDVARRLVIVPSAELRPTRHHSNVSTEVFIPKFKYWYKALYLLEGSSVLVEADSDSANVKLFIFNGRTRLEEWLERHEKKGLPLDKKNEDGDATKKPLATLTHVSYVLSIRETNNYYILFSYSEGRNALASLKLTLTVQRKVFDLENAVYSCEAAVGESCVAGLTFNSEEAAIIEVLGSSLTNDMVNSVSTWKCEPRVWFHVLLFGGIFLVFLVAVILISVLSLRRQKRKLVLRLQQMRDNFERQSLLSRSDTFRGSLRLNANGSLRRTPSHPPSRSSSLRSCSSQVGKISGRESRLLPVVTPMYTGLLGSEDSGHETDDEGKRATQLRSSAASRTSTHEPSAAYELVRKPSFSTFQGTDNGSDWEGLSRGRSQSAREWCTHPRARTDSCASAPAVIMGSMPSSPARPASVPTHLSAANQQTAVPTTKLSSEAMAKESDAVRRDIKFRSLPSRRRAMSWKPRLSMVSEV